MRRQRKLFIGIDIPPTAQKLLSRKIEEYTELPLRWEHVENYHITLMYLGHVDDEKIFTIGERLHDVCEEHEPFEIPLTSILLGPNAISPQLLWAEGPVNHELKEVREDVEKALDMFSREKKAFRPHITLGRVRTTKWEELSEQPEISLPINIIISADALVLYESIVEDGKKQYIPIDEFELTQL